MSANDNKVKSFEDLLAWQKAMTLSEESYKQIVKLPKEERFELGSQMRRAAISIPSNIAEGQQRGGTREYINFLNIAKGSNGELKTQLILCGRLGFIPNEELQVSLMLSDDVGRLLNLLIRSLEQKLK